MNTKRFGLLLAATTTVIVSINFVTRLNSEYKETSEKLAALEERASLTELREENLLAEVSKLTETNGILRSEKAELEIKCSSLLTSIDQLNEKINSQRAINIYNIPLDAELQEYTYALCVTYGIPELYETALAVMWQESNFTVDAVSPTNDYGIMQINVCNHEWLKSTLGFEDIMDVRNNIHCGVYMLALLYPEYYDITTTLMAYNRGQDGAAALLAQGIYTTTYSEEVCQKTKAIELNSYTD